MASRKLVFISKLKPGSVQELTHELPIHFPAQALSQIEGIENVTICQGNDLFAAIVEYDGDFEEVFRKYVSSPSIRAFHYKISAHFEAPPRSPHPAELPLAGDVFYWDGKSLHRSSN